MTIQFPIHLKSHIIFNINQNAMKIFMIYVPFLNMYQIELEILIHISIYN